VKYEFRASGLLFKGNAPHRFVVCTRFPGASQIHLYVWRDLRSFDLPKTVAFVFDHARRTMPSRYVFAIDTEHEEFVGVAHGDEVLFDRFAELTMREGG
jgi:hypothetical protein